MKKRILSMALMLVVWIGLLPAAGFAESGVATVNGVEYATIDEAVAQWQQTNNSTLTLLADVTLSDVVVLKSTENHTLQLGVYTMTAADGKNAIQITSNGMPDRGERPALTIAADGTNPGGINAGSKACVYYKYDSNLAGNNYDRPIIYIQSGVFTSTGAGLSTSGHSSAQDKCATFNISGGIFNCNLSLTKAKLIVSGGEFNGTISCTGGSTSHRKISGGRFKSFSFLTTGSGKFGISKAGSDINSHDVGVYVDAEGYLVVGGDAITAPGTAYQASTNYGYWNSVLSYSSAAANGLYWTNIETAMAKKPSGTITVYVPTLDLTGTSFKGTLLLPAEKDLVVTFGEGTAPAWKVAAAATGDLAVYTENVSGGTVTRSYSAMDALINITDSGEIEPTAPAEQGKATVIAVPEDGYYFVNWTVNDVEVGTDVTYSFDPAQITSLQANFAAQTPETTPAAAFVRPDKLTGLEAGAAYGIAVDGTVYSCTADAAGAIAVEDAWFGKNVEIVKKASDNTRLDSEKQQLTLPVCYIVTLDYGAGASAGEIRLFDGEPLENPVPEMAGGKVFLGWYDDVGFTVIHDFSQPVTQNVVLYARFASAVEKVDKTTSGLVDTYTVTYTDGTTATFTVTNGADGKTAEFRVENNELQWKYTEDTAWNTVVDIDDLKGADGKTPVFKNEDDHLYVSYDNGSTYQDLGGVKGDKGDKGEAGVTPQLRVNSSNIWEVSYDNGVTWQSLGISAVGASGANGKDGADGKNGKNGVGIASIEKTASEGVVDTYTITLTNGNTYCFTVTNGTNGADGKDGQTPHIGENGNWWIGDTDTGVQAAGTNGKDGSSVVPIAVSGISLLSAIVMFVMMMLDRKARTRAGKH